MTLALSIDLDPLTCYAGIHGLSDVTLDARQRRYVMERCVPRALAQLADLGLRATFFVVARELAGPDAALAHARLGEIAAAGHEIASHSFAHDYGLAQRPDAEIAADLALADAHLGEATGVGVVGFRAPGYDTSAALARALEQRGYRYDSSLLPAPGYWLAKAAVMGAMRLRGRTSGAVITNPRALLAPRHPFIPSLANPWRAASQGVGNDAASYWQLPVMVTPIARMPVIGTSLALAPAWLRRRMLAVVADMPLCHLEFHGIDWAQSGDAEVGFLRAVQPDVRVSLRAKSLAFASLLAPLAASRDNATLAEYVAAANADATRLGAPAHRSAH